MPTKSPPAETLARQDPQRSREQQHSEHPPFFLVRSRSGKADRQASSGCPTSPALRSSADDGRRSQIQQPAQHSKLNRHRRRFIRLARRPYSAPQFAIRDPSAPLRQDDPQSPAPPPVAPHAAAQPPPARCPPNQNGLTQWATPPKSAKAGCARSVRPALGPTKAGEEASRCDRAASSLAEACWCVG